MRFLCCIYFSFKNNFLVIVPGAYRITYVTDDDDDDVVDDNLHQTRKQLRSLSLDSFDKFCRSGSMSKEEKQKSTNANEDGDDDDDDNGFVRRELNTVSPPADEIEGKWEFLVTVALHFEMMPLYLK